MLCSCGGMKLKITRATINPGILGFRYPFSYLFFSGTVSLRIQADSLRSLVVIHCLFGCCPIRLLVGVYQFLFLAACLALPDPDLCLERVIVIF